jgi:hypothetical protein
VSSCRGECRFEADGTFVLTARAAGVPQTLPGRYSYANGVLLMAGDRREVRAALHWVKGRRFTLRAGSLRVYPYPAAGMLIFDRQPDAGGATAPPPPEVAATEHPPRITERTNGPRPPTGGRPFANAPGGPFPGGQMHSGEEPSTKWVIAGVLLGSACVFLLLAVKVRGHRNPWSTTSRSTSTAA